MKHKKPLALRIFIRICVVFMALSLIGVYVVYMFAPTQKVGEDDGTFENAEDFQNPVEDFQVITGDVEIVDEILPEINPDEPENTEAPILVTEEGEIDELDQTIEVQLENGETEIVRQGDLGTDITID